MLAMCSASVEFQPDAGGLLNRAAMTARAYERHCRFIALNMATIPPLLELTAISWFLMPAVRIPALPLA